MVDAPLHCTCPSLFERCGNALPCHTILFVSASTSRVSHAAIAKQAGVSRSTVSRALANHPRISEEVRHRVRQLAERMGYRPDPQLSKLMAGMRGLREGGVRALLAFILPEEDYPSDYGQALLDGARRRAHSLGYAVDEFRTGFTRGQLRTLNRVLRARGVEGVLILPRHRVEAAPAGLDLTQVATVSCAQFSGQFPVHHAGPNHFTNIALVMEEAQRRGLLRPGLISWEDFDRRQHWAPRMAYYHYYHQIARSAPPPIFDWHRHQGDLTRPLLGWFHKTRPDFLLVVGPLIAEAVKHILQDGGIPGMPPFFLIGHAPSGWPGINEKPAGIGSAAVDMLTSHIVRNEKGIPPLRKILTLPGVLQTEFSPQGRQHGEDRLGPPARKR